jgi:hypothetical protein
MAKPRQAHGWRHSLLLVPVALAACTTTPPALVPLRQGTPLVIEVLARPRPFGARSRAGASV